MYSIPLESEPAIQKSVSRRLTSPERLLRSRCPAVHGERAVRRRACHGVRSAWHGQASDVVAERGESGKTSSSSRTRRRGARTCARKEGARSRGRDRRSARRLLAAVTAAAAAGDSTDKGAELLGVVVDEGHGRARNDVAEEPVTRVVVERLGVVGHVDRNGAGDAAGDNAGREGEGDGEGHAADEHLA